MRAYTIYHKSSEPADILRHGDDAVFVKEGFSWAAMFSQIIWLLFHRLWMASAVYVAVLVIMLAIGGVLSGPAGVIMLGALIIGLAVEANDIREFFLLLKGYQTVGLVEGRSLADCERQFFTEMEKSARAQPKAMVKPPMISNSLSDEGETAIGLFPKPGV